MTAVPLAFPQGAILLHQERKIKSPSSPAPCTISAISTCQCLSAGSLDMNGALIAFRVGIQTRNDIPVTLLAARAGQEAIVHMSLWRRGQILCWRPPGKKAGLVALGRDCPLNFHFLPKERLLKLKGDPHLKKKKNPSKIQSFEGENATAFPSKFCIFKGRFVLQEAAFGSHLRRRSSFFASLISPFVLSGSSDESHGTCRKAILNSHFLCQTYKRLKPDKGGHRHSPCCSWAGLDGSQPLAVPGDHACSFAFFQLQIPFLWREKWGSQICPSLLLPPGFGWRQSWRKISFITISKHLCFLFII